MQVPKISANSDYRNQTKTNFKGLKELTVFENTLQELGLKCIKKDHETVRTFCISFMKIIRERYGDSIRTMQLGMKKPIQDEYKAVERLHFLNHEGEDISISWGYLTDNPNVVFIKYHDFLRVKDKMGSMGIKIHLIEQEASLIPNNPGNNLQAVI